MAKKGTSNEQSGDTLLFAGWPDKTVDAGELGVIQFDGNGAAIVSQVQADWLAEQIAGGHLPEPAAPGEPLTEIEPVVKTVAMCREAIDDGPTTADVHPDEVASWQAHGWQIAQLASDEA